LFALLFRLIALFILATVGLAILLWLLHLLGALIAMAIGVLMLAGIVYLICFLFNINLGFLKKAQSFSYKVSSYKQPAVALFMAEPSVNQLINVENQNQLTEWALNGSILEIDNNTEVIILEDAREKQAVHIKVKAGQHKGRDGWVCRSTLQQSAEKLLPG